MYIDNIFTYLGTHELLSDGDICVKKNIIYLHINDKKLDMFYQEKLCNGNHRIEIIFLVLHDYDLEGSHANVILIDHVKHEYERFEPNGRMKNYDKITNKFLISSDFINLFGVFGYKYIKPREFCFGPQTLLIGTNLAGSCVIWTLWYIDQRLIFPDISRKEIIDSVDSIETAIFIMNDMLEHLDNLGLHVSDIQDLVK